MTTEFSTVFLALWTGHTVGDHWIQTNYQAMTKGQPGWPGRLACTRHVVSLTLAKVVFLLAAWTVLDLEVSAAGLVLGMTLDAGSHYWADRRTTLEGLARAMGKSGFYHLGADTRHDSAPPGSHLGTGKYVLDQSFHMVFLFTASLVIAAV